MWLKLKEWFSSKELKKPLDLTLLSEKLYRLKDKKSYEKYWDAVASTRELAYFGVVGLPFGELPNEENIDRHGKATADIIIRKLGITPQDDVLEVGVGVGRLAKHIALSCKTFTGIDISSRMIRHAKERLKGLNNVKLFSHPKSDLSLFRDQSFDKIFFQIVLIHLDREDIFNYLKESFRVLKPNGMAWFQFYNLLHPKGFEEFQNAVELANKLGEKLRGRVQCHTSFEVRKLVESSGFKIREDLSHLEPIEQHYDFEPPDTDWFYYLIAVGEKPGV